jgi:hypothetical protein
MRISFPRSLLVLTRRQHAGRKERAFPAWRIALLLKASGGENGGVLLAKLSIMRRWHSRNKKPEMAVFPGYAFAHPTTDRDIDRLYIRGTCGLVFLVQEPLVQVQEAAAKTRRGLEALKLMMRSGAALTAKPKLGGEA